MMSIQKLWGKQINRGKKKSIKRIKLNHLKRHRSGKHDRIGRQRHFVKIVNIFRMFTKIEESMLRGNIKINRDPNWTFRVANTMCMMKNALDGIDSYSRW